jgi:hypothetical protein
MTADGSNIINTIVSHTRTFLAVGSFDPSMGGVDGINRFLIDPRKIHTINDELKANGRHRMTASVMYTAGGIPKFVCSEREMMLYRLFAANTIDRGIRVMILTNPMLTKSGTHVRR